MRGPSGNTSARGPEVVHLLAELGPSFARGDVHAGLNPVVLDFNELRRVIKAMDGAEKIIAPCRGA
jgi:hypothetical protein